MLQQIISKIIAHKAAVMLGGAMAGTVAVAVFAAKDGQKHKINLMVADADKLTELDDDELYEYEEKEDHHPGELLSKKERAIIFAKSYWRTGLCMAVTFGLMILSHRSMAKELAATAAALGVMGTKYKDLQLYLKENYPEEYGKVMQMIDQKNSQRKISEKSFKEETYDGRYRCYEPITEQVFFSKLTPGKLADECSIFINKGLLNDHIVSVFDYVDNIRKLSGDKKLKTKPWMHKAGWCLEDETFDYNASFSPDGYSVRVTAEPFDLKDKDGDISVVNSLTMWHIPCDFTIDICENYV